MQIRQNASCGYEQLKAGELEADRFLSLYRRRDDFKGYAAAGQFQLV